MFRSVLAGLLLATVLLRAQDEELPAVARPKENVIQRPLELGFFFRKLKALEERRGGDFKRVSILEIGDSHLQGDEFSHPLRLALGKRFGLAGRGLIFPYTVAQTSNAWDLVSESNLVWLHRRSAVPAPQGLEDLDTGAAGFSIMTRDPGYILRLGVNGQDSAFDLFSVFSRRDARAYGMRISTHTRSDVLKEKGLLPRDRLHLVVAGDTLSSLSRLYQVELKDLRQWNHIKNDQIYAGESLVVQRELSAQDPPEGAVAGFRDVAVIPGGASQDVSVTVRLENPVHDVFLRGLKDEVGESEAVIYGATVERAGRSGIFYHTAGVNGAQLKNFVRSARFFQQARCLDPDLVIIALGTNESMSDDDRAWDIEDNMLAILGAFTKNNPKYVAFLVVTPPDVLDWGGRFNPRVAEVAARLRDFASRHGLALWDWQSLMGGQGSVLSWREQHLVQTDGVHMTNAGYQLQSRYFFQALMDAYERY
jgi:lysophospholipase L1-like esterase